jgi:hypothetical protein
MNHSAARTWIGTLTIGAFCLAARIVTATPVVISFDARAVFGLCRRLTASGINPTDPPAHARQASTRP